MNYPIFGRRKRVGFVCLWVLAGVWPLSGCAARRAMDERLGFSPTTTATATADSARSEPTAQAVSKTGTAEANILPAQPPFSSVRLVSEERPLLTSQGTASQPLGNHLELARTEIRSVGKASVRTVVHANEATFEQQVLRSDVPVLVDFYASWCGPCKQLAPTLEEMAAESPRAKVVKVDIDDSPELAARYGVKSIPSLMVFKGGQVVAKQQGMISKTRMQSMLDL